MVWCVEVEHGYAWLGGFWPPGPENIKPLTSKQGMVQNFKEGYQVYSQCHEGFTGGTVPGPRPRSKGTLGSRTHAAPPFVEVGAGNFET